MTVTIASPVPSVVQHLAEVVAGLRVGRDGRPQRLGVVGGEGAQLVLHARAELGEHVARHVLRRLRDEEDADALRADEPHRLRDRREEVLRRVREQQVRLVEEEHQLRLVEVADLGQVVEQVGEQPHQEGREQRRLVLHPGHLEQADDAACRPAAVRRNSAVSISGSPKNTSAPWSAKVMSSRRITPTVALREPAELGELGLALVADEVGEHGAQVGEVERAAGPPRRRSGRRGRGSTPACR